MYRYYFPREVKNPEREVADMMNILPHEVLCMVSIRLVRRRGRRGARLTISKVVRKTIGYRRGASDQTFHNLCKVSNTMKETVLRNEELWDQSEGFSMRRTSYDGRFPARQIVTRAGDGPTIELRGLQYARHNQSSQRGSKRL